jgi:hypothetical protein
MCANRPLAGTRSKPFTVDGGFASNAGRGALIRSCFPPPRSARKICYIDCGPTDPCRGYRRGWVNWRGPTRRPTWSPPREHARIWPKVWPGRRRFTPPKAGQVYRLTGPQVLDINGLAEQYSRALGGRSARKTFPTMTGCASTCGTRGSPTSFSSISRPWCVCIARIATTGPLMTWNRSPVNPRRPSSSTSARTPNCLPKSAAVGTFAAIVQVWLSHPERDTVSQRQQPRRTSRPTDLRNPETPPPRLLYTPSIAQSRCGR